MKKAAIFLPNWVGDAVMATPAIRAIREGFGSSVELIGVGRPGATSILEGLPFFDKVLTYKPKSRGKLANRRSTVFALRRERIDLAVLLPNSMGTAIMAYLSGARRRIGYDRDSRGWLLTEKLQAPRTKGKYDVIPAIDYYLRISEALGCWSSNRQMELAVTANDQELANQLWSQVEFQHDHPTVVINSSGAFGGAKLWPAQHVVELAKRLSTEHNLQVMLHCGPDEKAAANSIVDSCNDPRVQSMGRLANVPLGLTKAVMARGTVVVSTDSGPRHIAIALNRPVVSIFGPTSLDWTVTYNLPETVLTTKLDCQPCWKRTCPLKHHRCMTELSVEQVFQETIKLLPKTQPIAIAS